MRDARTRVQYRALWHPLYSPSKLRRVQAVQPVGIVLFSHRNCFGTNADVPFGGQVFVERSPLGHIARLVPPPPQSVGPGLPHAFWRTAEKRLDGAATLS